MQADTRGSTSVFPDYIDPISGERFVSDDSGDALISPGRTVPIVDGIPRFVSSENYAASFGQQWLTFARTQLDSVSGHPISESRLVRALKNDPAWLRGKLVLEAGCGAGRFTEVLLKMGARVDSIDLSRAVEANKANCPTGPDHRVTQADIYTLPFPRRSYDLVLCLGVVQHTPDSGRTIRTLASYAKDGGHLVFDHYIGGILRGSNRRFGARLIRPRVLRLPLEQRLPYVERLVARWYPIHRAVGRSRLASHLLRTISPVTTYHDTLPLTEAQHREWSILDTHDSLTDVYKATLTRAEVESLVRSLKIGECHCHLGDNGVVCDCHVTAPKNA
jgi:SAM-dependent methyltransferase